MQSNGGRISGTLLVLVVVAACSKAPPPEKAATAPPATPAPASAPTASPLSGVGNHHHSIATTSADAQRYFDQGFDLVFGFNHEEAARSFKRAAELDPKAPMPHWGIAWALGPNYNLDVDDERAEAGERGDRQGAGAVEGRIGRGARDTSRPWPSGSRPIRNPIARRWRASTRTRCARCRTPVPGRPRRGHALRREPDEPARVEALDAGWKARRAHRGDRRGAGVRAGARSRITSAPITITFTPSKLRRRRGARCPARCGSITLAPAAGHLAHMPAHIYARVGDHAGAARANEAGAQADREYFKTAPADNVLRAGVLHAQPALPRRFRDDARQAGRGAPRGRRGGRANGAAHADDADGRIAR